MNAPAPLPKWVKANGLEFAYLEEGEGPLVLCLHGFPDTAWSFRPLLKALAAAGFRGVAPFMRGYTPSAIPADGDYSVAMLGRDVIALIDHLGGEQAAVVGHDWGAAATYAAATMRSDRISRIVTAAVPHLRRFLLRPNLRQLKRSRYMGLFQIPSWAERRIPRDDMRWLEELIRKWSPGWQFTAEDLAPIKAMLADSARLSAALGYYRAMPRSLIDSESWRLLLKAVPVPARVIRGRNDGCIGREMFEGQGHLFASQYDLVEIADAGHFMHCEQPEAFNAAVIEFLRPLRATV